MFDRLGRLAEGMATNVGTSRRGFLGRLGRSALGAAGALGALTVAAAAQTGGVVCCTYRCKPIGGYGSNKTYTHKVCLPAGSTCPNPGFNGYCPLQHTSTASDCSKC
jgi:hypothetical protein